MTSEGIAELKGRMAIAADHLSTPQGQQVNAICSWLAEIAYQLAKRNEGPMGARMEKLLRAYAADDPCAPNDPRYKEAVEILAAIDQLAKANERNEAKA